MTHILIGALLAFAALLAIIITRRIARRLTHGVAVNIAEGTHGCSLTKRTDAVISTRYLLAKPGSDANHVDVCGAADMPLGIFQDEPEAIEDPVAVRLLGLGDHTAYGVASEAVALTDELYTAANGKLQNLPTASGTYWKVGRPLITAAADGDRIEFLPIYPVKLVIP